MDGPTAAAGPNRVPAPGECWVSERRLSERFPCDQPVICGPPVGGHVKWPARVRHVSAGGLCLVLPRRFEPGAALTVEWPREEGTPPSTILARVVYARAEPGGVWALGCRFLGRLGEDDMKALLRAAPAEGPCLA
jgi:hypothetical protein